MVYIDNMNAPYRGMKMCHMIADSTEELLNMADAIGVQRKWIQDAGTYNEHFDICSTKKAKAVKLGAQEITMMALGRMLATRPGHPLYQKHEPSVKPLTPMKVISLYQPYASFMVWNHKKNETRHWDTSHRGILGIHAAQSKPAWCRNLCAKEEAFIRVLAEHGVTFNDLPRGCILGTVNVVDMVKTEVWEHQNGLNEFTQPSRELQDEWWFGNYERGRWAWVTTDAVCFDQPIMEKGSQGFWTYPRPPKEPKPEPKAILVPPQIVPATPPLRPVQLELFG